MKKPLNFTRLPYFGWLSLFCFYAYGTPLRHSTVSFPPMHFPANEIISPHKPIYNIPYHHVQDLDGPSYYHDLIKRRKVLTAREMVIQGSGKVLLCQLNEINFYFAYSLRAHWQVHGIKDPYFRAYDHQPEFFINLPLSLYGRLFNLRIGHVHKSNGMGNHIEPERSWDRLYFSVKADISKWSVLLKLWYIIQATVHYNPTIGDHLGYGKVIVTYHFSPDHHISFSKRLFENREKIAWDRSWEVTYLFPILPAIQIIVRGFSGYGADMNTCIYPTLSLGGGIALRFV